MLAALATTDDLTARGITVPDGMDAPTLLDAASAAIRQAAGTPISTVTATVDLTARDFGCLPLPGPVQSVATVVVDGDTLTGWTLLDGALVMPRGWTRCLPTTVTVTLTFGLAEVPADIVDMVCALVAQAAQDGGGDYGSGGRRSSVRLGDFSESFTHPSGTESASPMELPDGQRQRLAARFGNSVGMSRMR